MIDPERAFPPDFPIVKLSNNRAQLSMRLTLRAKEKTPRGVQEKLFVEVTDYASTPHVYLSHAVDGPVFRVVAHAIAADRWMPTIAAAQLGKEPACRVREAIQTPGAHVYQWTEFKGGPTDQGVVSRLLSFSFLDAPGQEYPWTVQLSEGPGRTIGSGAVAPAGKPTRQVQMRLSSVQMMQWMLMGLEALQAYTTAAVAASPLILRPRG